MKIINRNYEREFEALEKFEAGVALTGAEVKSIREGRLNLENAYVKIMESGVYLINAEVAAYKHANNENYDPTRRRKLLLTQKELERIKGKIASSPGLTIIPIACYNKGRLLKLEIALSRGRKDLEKRKREKAKEVERTQKREAKEYLKS